MRADPTDENSDIVWVKYTKLDGPPAHQLWKLKDEQYRVNSIGTMGIVNEETLDVVLS